MGTEETSLFFALLAVAGNLAVLGAAVLVIGGRLGAVRPVRARLAAAVRPSSLWIVWLAAAGATAGSLYYSEVAGFPPCRLCWLQRGLMYPLVALLLWAALRPNEPLRHAGRAVAIGGAAVSLWHLAIERFPALEGGIACAGSNPCSLRWVEELGFVTIPYMAFSAFALIAAGLSVRPPAERGTAGFTRAPVLVVAGIVAVAGLSATLAVRAPATPEQAEYGQVTVRGAALVGFSGPVRDPAIGQALPVLVGIDFSGAPVTVGDAGRPAVIVVVAHWCPHCQREVPNLVGWLAAGNGAGVDLVAISTAADPKAPNWPASRWLASEGWDRPVIVDDRDRTAAQALGVSGFPFFVVVDAHGAVVGRWAGAIPVDLLADVLRQLVGTN
jgi:disulfide bond formation protein DsbB/thiol-disulfide isomerase/thioredoxin